MLLLVCHLTRMHKGHVCLAGLDMETGGFIRPVLAGSSSWSSEDLLERGGLFSLGAILQLDRVVNVSLPPEVEDRMVSRGSVKRLCQVHAGMFGGLVKAVARRSVTQLFGQELDRSGDRPTAPAGRGKASLGVLSPASCVTLDVLNTNGKERIRLRCADEQGDLNLPVTDIRLYNPDTGEPNRSTVERLCRRLTGSTALLAMGLTRPYAPTIGSAKQHYLQVNNIFPEDDPLWREEA